MNRPRPPGKPIHGVVIAFPLLVGGALLALAIGLGLAARAGLDGAVSTPGKVVELVRADVSQQTSEVVRAAWVPVVEYQFGEQLFRIQGLVASRSFYNVGETVTVLVPPDRPGEGRIDTFLEMWARPLAFGAGGALFTLVGLFLLLARWRGVTS